MWQHHLVNLLCQSWDLLLSGVGTTTLGIMIFSFAVPIVILLISFGVNLTMTKQATHFVKKIALKDSILPTTISIAAVVLLLGGLFAVYVGATVYRDHQGLVVLLTKPPGHCLSMQQIGDLTSALERHPSEQGFSTSSVYIVYSAASTPPGLPLSRLKDPGIADRAKCVSDLLSAFISAHWEPVIRRTGPLDPDGAYAGIVFAYFTERRPLPQYDNLRLAFRKAHVPYSKAHLDFSFNEEYSSRPEMVNPIIYVGDSSK